MKKLPGKIIYIYSFVFSITIFILNTWQAYSENNLLFILFLLPLPIYYIFSIVFIIKNNKTGAYIASSKAGLGGALIIFVVLSGIGFMNLKQTQASNQDNDSPPQSPGVVINKRAYEKKELKIILTDDQEFVDIKRWPTSESETIEKAYSENQYFYVLKQKDWYKIVLNSGQFGWINEINILELE